MEEKNNRMKSDRWGLLYTEREFIKWSEGGKLTNTETRTIQTEWMQQMYKGPEKRI